MALNEIKERLEARLKEAQAERSKAKECQDLGFEAYHMGRELELTYIIKLLELEKERAT